MVSMGCLGGGGPAGAVEVGGGALAAGRAEPQGAVPVGGHDSADAAQAAPAHDWLRAGAGLAGPDLRPPAHSDPPKLSASCPVPGPPPDVDPVRPVTVWVWWRSCQPAAWAMASRTRATLRGSSPEMS